MTGGAKVRGSHHNFCIHRHRMLDKRFARRRGRRQLLVSGVVRQPLRCASGAWMGAWDREFIQPGELRAEMLLRHDRSRSISSL